MKKLILATLVLIGIAWLSTVELDPIINVQPTNNLDQLTGEMEQMEAELNQLLSFTGGN